MYTEEKIRFHNVMSPEDIEEAIKESCFVELLSQGKSTVIQGSVVNVDGNEIWIGTLLGLAIVKPISITPSNNKTNCFYVDCDGLILFKPYWLSDFERGTD